MIVHWQRVGFVHGVMNTDNMSIHGLTIDYGPYGWLEDYNPGWTPNTTDREYKRYRFGAQPHIGQWNCTQLANAIYPLVGEVEPLQEALETYVDVFNTDWRRMMGDKLGIAELDGERDTELIHDLLELLPKIETDMTLFFRGSRTSRLTTVSTLTLALLHSSGPITTRTPSPAMCGPRPMPGSIATSPDSARKVAPTPIGPRR